MIPLLRRLFMVEATPTRPASEVPIPGMEGAEPEIRSSMVLVRSEGSFYHNLTDEDFCAWARGWSSRPQVLTPEDRERILDRLRSEHPVWEPV